MTWTPNRIVAFGGAACSIVVGAVGTLAGIAGPGAAVMAAGIVGAAALAREWLIGWREHEARQGEADQPVGWDDVEELADELAKRPDVIIGAARRAGLKIGTEPPEA